jgi:hypothetical protein
VTRDLSAEKRVMAMAQVRGLDLCLWPPHGPRDYTVSDPGRSDPVITDMYARVFGPASLAECERWLDS